MKAGGPALYKMVDRHRAVLGLTWVAVSSESGLSRSTIANWRSGARKPTAAAVVRVAATVGLDEQSALRAAGLISAVIRLEAEDPWDRVHRLTAELNEALEVVQGVREGSRDDRVAGA